MKEREVMGKSLLKTTLAISENVSITCNFRKKSKESLLETICAGLVLSTVEVIVSTAIYLGVVGDVCSIQSPIWVICLLSIYYLSELSGLWDSGLATLIAT